MCKNTTLFHICKYFFCHCIIKPNIETETQTYRNIKNFYLRPDFGRKTAIENGFIYNSSTSKHCHNTIKQYKTLKQ